MLFVVIEVSQQSHFSGSSHKGTTGLKKIDNKNKKYYIELRVRELEDLKNGVGMKTVRETHQVEDIRCIKYILHRLQGEWMYM